MIRSIYLLLTISFFCQNDGWTQTLSKPLQSWNSIGVRAGLRPGLDLGFSQQYSFASDPFSFRYLDNDLHFQFEALKVLDITLGGRYTLYFREGLYDGANYRVYAEAGLRQKSGIWRLKHELRLEKHDPNEPRYDWRVVYSFNIRPKSNWIKSPLKFFPYFSTQLFYNIGGDPVTQFSDEGQNMGKAAPYGFHRLRVRLGAGIRPANFLRVSVYGMYQQEFNTPHAIHHYHRINNVNPRTDNVSREFSNYFVLGTSLTFDLPDLYRKKK